VIGVREGAGRLHALAARLSGTSDLLLAIAALAIVTLLVAPLPAWLLDLGLAANLALSATVLLAALFAPEALRLASFPALLLLTTLYRLALEVSSTRLVLSRGHAGRIIEAFGRVVVAGDYVVGGVVFAILTLVQFLVVAKGGERVAEVAARFTLDALPGKQMSIDADLRAGAIDQVEARRRRRALEREGQLYGAMDGALKFVKGDVLAGIAIVLVNVAGGLVAGLVRGMPLEAAARRYALLAIGDGLAAQIPALLVSVAAGVVVTRVAAEEEGGTLARELGSQLFTDPRALAAVAVLCGAMILLPGLPAAPFAALAVVAGAAAYAAGRRRAAGSASAGRPGDGPGCDRGRHRQGPGGAPGLAPAAQVALELAPDLAELVTRAATHSGAAPVPGGAARLLDALGDDLWRAVGVRLPPVDIRAASGLASGTWRLLLDEVPAATGRAPPSEAVALIPAPELAALGIAATAEPDPLSGAQLARISAADAARAALLAPVRGPVERLGAALAAALRDHAHHFVGVQEVHGLLEALEPSHPALVNEISRQVPAPILAEVLRRLLEERVPARPLRAILEAALESGAVQHPAALAESCRRALNRQIAHHHARAGVLEALLLDPDVDAALRRSSLDGAPALDPTEHADLLAAVERALSALEHGRAPCIVTDPQLRRGLRQLIAPRFPRLAVLSYDELPPALPVRPLGKIALDPAGEGARLPGS
jgi:type III secretion protein V